MILTVKLIMPGANTERAIVTGGIVMLESCCRSSYRPRNCRSAITCYWGNPRYGTLEQLILITL